MIESLAASIDTPFASQLPVSRPIVVQCYAPKLVLDEELRERGEAPDGRISPPDLEVPSFATPPHRRPPLTRLPVAWLRPLMALDEEAVVQYAGLDAAVLLRVFDMARTLRPPPQCPQALPIAQHHPPASLSPPSFRASSNVDSKRD